MKGSVETVRDRETEEWEPREVSRVGKEGKEKILSAQGFLCARTKPGAFIRSPILNSSSVDHIIQFKGKESQAQRG